MLGCEPLHDIKGHFSHHLEELPFLLGSPDRAAVEEIIKATTSNTMTGEVQSLYDRGPDPLQKAICVKGSHAYGNCCPNVPFTVHARS